MPKSRRTLLCLASFAAALVAAGVAPARRLPAIDKYVFYFSNMVLSSAQIPPRDHAGTWRVFGLAI